MLNEIIIEFEKYKDQDSAIKQEAYLRNQFKFIGMPKPSRSKVEKPFIQRSKELTIEQLIDLVYALARLEEREYLYCSQQMLIANAKRFELRHVCDLIGVTLFNPWWENTDGFASFVHKWLKAKPYYVREFVEMYYKDDEMWIRRLAIISQLGLKKDVDFVILKRAIKYNMKYDEFFIQKAIGWALRDYSKYNPQGVEEFIDKNEEKLSKLAIREGSKYLGG